jgi:glyoxylase-like metal-dependent hydrolase (beta-lactamase superfamily II)/ferredoxin
VARLDLRHRANIEGDWFVDERCIDCDTCRQMAPAVFDDIGEQTVVRHQPVGAGEVRDAFRAMVACPTQSIGSVARLRPPPGLFPEVIAPGVYACGFHSEHSFGAWSYFVERAAGNLLVDSPRWTRQLAEPMAERGGLAQVLLTHRDDVADAARYAERFGARVWIHEADRSAAPFATDVLRGDAPTTIAPGVVAVPVPGHTRGSVVFVVDDEFCFSGDSLAWSRERRDVTAFRDACWYSWPTQIDSLARLADSARFEWLLPGHGDRVHLDAGDMNRRLRALVARAAVQR